MITLVAYKKIRLPGAHSLIFLSLALVLWSSSYLLHEIFPLFLFGKFWTSILFFSTTIAASAQFTFALSYTNRSNWLNRFGVVFLGIMPVITQILFWVVPWHDIFFIRQSVMPIDPTSMGLWPKINLVMALNLKSLGVWSNINDLYIFGLIGASVFIFMDKFIQKPRSLLFHPWIILAGSAVPFLILSFNILDKFPLPQTEFLLLGFSISGLGFSYGIFNDKLIEKINLTRRAMVESMDDGWIVLDRQNTIVDINPSAEKLIGSSLDKAYGQPISSVLSAFPNLARVFDMNQEVEMKRTVELKDGWRYLNIRASILTNEHKKDLGRLITWHDITEQKAAEDARQLAREEIFVLLNAISSAASNTIQLNDFLTESIYQIIYPFRCQVAGIFLIEDGNKKEDEPKLVLAAHFGFSSKQINAMTYFPLSSSIFDWVTRNKKSLLVEDIKNDPLIPHQMREIDFSSLLVIPLIHQAQEEGKLLGFLCMARKEKPIFSQDEIIRLSIVSDHVATLIDNDRRRKLAIALSERQRVMRDLHDSVSQKLYGLVTLTEVAQATLEAGSTLNPGEVLSKIGDSARQAVKEMRLFLFQLQPSDIENDGLISVLHNRLAAVEGRADIKVKFTTDEEITLSKENEVALYFIAQEALNNILRHAHAKSISVSLKQGRQSVTLEIKDTGCGFDVKKVGNGGLGLRNMEERVRQINGKMKIYSKLGEGTRVVINVRKAYSAKSEKRRQ
jgi:PAS domain S-box-containing protein